MGGLGKFVVVAVVCLCTLPVAVIAGEALPVDPVHRADTCAACHNALPEGVTLPASDAHCGDCHDQPVPAPTATPAASSVAAVTLPSATPGPRPGAEPNDMVLIPAGTFTMGTDERLSDEGPPHQVRLEAFRIDVYEVTNQQYKQFIDATGRRSPPHFENRTWPDGKADHPVVFVSWMDADAYCRWAGKRLPTDQEWEKAARGTDNRRYPWGDEFSLSAANTPQRWKELNQEGDTLPVGSFPEGRSPYGLYDMSGNVWEWTASWYQAYPGNNKDSGNYGQTYKTLKGGSWWDCSFYKCGISAPVYNRAFFLKTTRNSSFGFRCAADAK